MPEFQYVEQFWPALAAVVVSAAFPFFSQLRKSTIHFSDQTRALSNALAATLASAVILLLIIERHALNLHLAAFPAWPWLVMLGIGLITFHCALVRVHHAAEGGPSLGLLRGLIEGTGMCVYVLAFGLLTLGFNRPLFESQIFTRVQGSVECSSTRFVELKNEDHTIARSPVVDGRYQFLLRPGELKSGLAVSAGNKEVIVDDATTKPQLKLDIRCV